MTDKSHTPKTAPNTCVTALWLRTIGGRTQVLVEQGGRWRIAIDEYGAPKEQEISHIAEARGVDKWPFEDI